MKLFIALAIVAVASASNYAQFAEFTSRYNKVYASAEEFKIRFNVFVENFAVIAERNAANVLNGGEEVHGITEFSDMTPNEFKATFLMNNWTPHVSEEEVFAEIKVDLNTTVDWRTQGALTPVKNQGRCGSCWAFSTAVAIESYAHLKNNQPLRVLSPQQIVSCDGVDHACQGGNTETGYQYVVRAGGLMSESSYPYHSGVDGLRGTCKFQSNLVVQKITGYRSVTRSEAGLVAALNDGPVSVCLGASSWSSYRGGILTSCPGPVDHCVQAVGYTDGAFVIRNQWGTSWGEAGFMRIARGRNLCNIAGDATFPTF